MELQKQIRISITIFLLILFTNFCYTQNKEAIIVINDTIRNYSNLHMIENIKIKYDNLNIIEVNYWPSKNISMVLCKKRDDQYLQLGFDYAGNLISQKECNLINDEIILNGKSFFYDDIGNITHYYTYRNGVFNGAYISFFENGAIETIGQYLVGEKNGVWMFYLKSGKRKIKVYK